MDRRFDGESIQPSHEVEQISGIVKFAGLVSFLAFSEILSMSVKGGKESDLEELDRMLRVWCYGGPNLDKDQ